MQLVSTAAVALRIVGARMRRNAVAYAICAVSIVAALVLATWASVLALLPTVGPIYAPLIVAGIYALIALAAIIWLHRAKSRPLTGTPLRAGDAPQQQLRFAQLAMIVEAALLGYYLSQRSDRR